MDKNLLKSSLNCLNNLSSTQQGHSNSDLFNNDDEDVNQQVIYLVISLNKMLIKPSHKPINLSLKHPIVNPIHDSICLFTKDPKDEYKKLLEDQNINFINKVLDCKKLKTKYRNFELHRNLLSDHQLFLCDEKILHLLPKLIGKQAFNNNKKPVPVNLSSNDLKSKLISVINSTQLHLSSGTCINLKFTKKSHSIDQQIENFNSILPSILKTFDGFQNIKSLHLKLPQSDSLPIFINQSVINSQQTQATPKTRSSTSTSKSNSKNLALGNQKPSKKPKKAN